MRNTAVFLSTLFMAGIAAAQPLSVAKGQWTVSSDIYFSGTMDGADVSVPPEFAVEDACWSLPEEVQFDASTLLTALEGCTASRSRATSYSLDLDIICDFGGMPMNGPAEVAISEDSGAFMARIRLQSDLQGADVQADMVMLGHRTGACTP
jgi:hypothetical protein